MNSMLGSLLCLLSFVSSVIAITPLTIKGTKFFDASGNQIYFKGTFFSEHFANSGMAYQRAPFDPFLNATQCQLDASLMQYLGVNVIRSIYPFSFWTRTNGSVSCRSNSKSRWVYASLLQCWDLRVFGPRYFQYSNWTDESNMERHSICRFYCSHRRIRSIRKYSRILHCEWGIPSMKLINCRRLRRPMVQLRRRTLKQQRGIQKHTWKRKGEDISPWATQQLTSPPSVPCSKTTSPAETHHPPSTSSQSTSTNGYPSQMEF